MHVRVEEERARRIVIQATVSRRVDDLTRMLDPSVRDRSHAENVRSLVMSLGEVGALEPDQWPDVSADELQEALAHHAALVQAWMESNLREAAQ